MPHSGGGKKEEKGNKAVVPYAQALKSRYTGGEENAVGLVYVSGAYELGQRREGKQM